MNFLIYLFITIIITFFTWKYYEPIILQEIEESDRYNKEMTDQYSFWIMIIVILFWPIVLPIVAIWELLDIIYNKFNKNKNEEL